MKIIALLILAFVVYWTSEFLSIILSLMIGSGPNEIGMVGSAISLLITTVVICTIIIVDAINKIKIEK